MCVRASHRDFGGLKLCFSGGFWGFLGLPKMSMSSELVFGDVMRMNSLAENRVCVC